MSAEPMPHEEAVGLLDALRDGELEGEEAARVAAHLQACERCRAVEAALGGGLRGVVNAGDAAREPNLLPGVQRRLHLRSRGKFYARGEAQRTPSPWPLLIASVALLAALAVGYVALGQIGAATTAPPAASTSSSSAPR